MRFMCEVRRNKVPVPGRGVHASRSKHRSAADDAAFCVTAADRRAYTPLNAAHRMTLDIWHRCLQTYVMDGATVSAGERVVVKSVLSAGGKVCVRTAAGLSAVVPSVLLAAESAHGVLLGDFVGEGDGELSVRLGDEIVLLQPEQPNVIPAGWLLAFANGALGFVPETFVKITSDEVVPVAVSDEARPKKDEQPAVQHQVTGVVGTTNDAPPTKVIVVVGLGNFEPNGEEEIRVRTDGTPPTLLASASAP